MLSQLANEVKELCFLFHPVVLAEAVVPLVVRIWKGGVKSQIKNKKSSQFNVDMISSEEHGLTTAWT